MTERYKELLEATVSFLESIDGKYLMVDPLKDGSTVYDNDLKDGYDLLYDIKSCLNG